MFFLFFHLVLNGDLHQSREGKSRLWIAALLLGAVKVHKLEVVKFPKKGECHEKEANAS
jgi:hypothetical protein